MRTTGDSPEVREGLAVQYGTIVLPLCAVHEGENVFMYVFANDSTSRDAFEALP